MSVIIKKDEKIATVVKILQGDYSIVNFIEKFKEIYPKDWAKIEKSYHDHERKTKTGKSHPMPEPTQYLKNVFNVWLKNNK